MPARHLLYYITDRTAFAADEPTRRTRLLEKISEATRANVDYIQLREKDLPIRALESLARDAVAIITNLKTENPELKTVLLINSRTDVALAVEADGVHLRSNDITPQEAKQIWKSATGKCGAASCGAGTPAGQLSPREPQIAVSCHSPQEVSQAAASGATLAVFAPVFEKENSSPAGLAQLEKASRHNIPVLALGGITLSNAHSCLAAGAAGIAAIRLFQQNSIAEVVARFRSKS